MKWIKDCTRRLSEDDIRIWQKGEARLEYWIGVGMNSKFERNGDKVVIYYKKKEGEKVHKAICKFLENDENFDELCDDFVQTILAIHQLRAEMLPALIIFDEIDNYPEIASEYIKRRLLRIRASTHEESYK